MDEWILVEFPEIRTVLVDGTPCGQTNKPTLVQRGTHAISLDGTQNFTPPSITKLVVNTTKAKPMVFVFTIQS
jgi:hypothetical protein